MSKESVPAYKPFPAGLGSQELRKRVNSMPAQFETVFGRNSCGERQTIRATPSTLRQS
jgi:hypothetical protein